MAEAGLLDVWKLLGAIIARQLPFVQILIAVGSAFFVVMALEGIRASLPAMRKAATPDMPDTPTQPVLDVPVTTAAPPASTARLRTSKFAQRVAVRPLARVARNTKPLTFTKEG